MQQAVAQRQQSSRPSLSTIAQRGTPCLLLRYVVLHANLAYLSCSTPDCSQLQSVRRALAGAPRHSRPARAHRAHATRMGRAPRLTYVLDMPEATDGTHIPLRRVIVGGQPGELERECLPPALRFKIGADGVLTWEQEEESVAVDARPEGDGKEVAKLKVA